MLERVLGTVLMTEVGCPTQVADVVEQPGYDPKGEQPRTKGFHAFGRALVTIHQAGHCQRNVKRMLEVVVSGVAGAIAGINTSVQAGEILECAVNGARRSLRIEIDKDVINRIIHRLRIGGVDRIGHIVVAATRHAS